MADTTYLRHDVEPYVRTRLAETYKMEFAARVVTLRPGGTHEFDAVSADDTVVGAVKTASGRTSGGSIPSGKIKDALAELYYLTQVDAAIRVLVVTTPEFYQLMMRQLRGRLDPGISLKLVPLPSEMQARVEQVQRTASAEMGGR